MLKAIGVYGIMVIMENRAFGLTIIRRDLKILKACSGFVHELLFYFICFAIFINRRSHFPFNHSKQERGKKN